MGTRSPRSAAMRRVLQKLREEKRSAAWLGRRVSPKVTRQTVSGWPDVPDHYVSQIAKLLGLRPGDIRPDRAALYNDNKSDCIRQQA
jgi:hypothetical protein